MTKSRLPEEAARAFDNLAQRLAHAGQEGIHTLSLVSADRREGTSTCALNLARHLAEYQPENVLLVDANLRNPMLHRVVGGAAETGLSDLVSTDVSLGQVIVATDAPNLYLMPSGTPVSRPNQVLNSLNIDRIFAPQEPDFRYILFDTPPINHYPDALEVASQCDGVALVVHAEKTRREVILHAKSELTASNCNVIGVILNRRKYHIPDFLYKLV